MERDEDKTLDLDDNTLNALTFRNIYDGYKHRGTRLLQKHCIIEFVFALCCCPCFAGAMAYTLYLRCSRSPVEQKYRELLNEEDRNLKNYVELIMQAPDGDTLENKKELLVKLNVCFSLVQSVHKSIEREDARIAERMKENTIQFIEEITEDLKALAEANIVAHGLNPPVWAEVTMY